MSSTQAAVAGSPMSGTRREAVQSKGASVLPRAVVTEAGDLVSWLALHALHPLHEADPDGPPLGHPQSPPLAHCGEVRTAQASAVKHTCVV